MQHHRCRCSGCCDHLAEGTSVCLSMHKSCNDQTSTGARQFAYNHALPGRLELPTLRLTASRSNQLSYGSNCHDAQTVNQCLATLRGLRGPRGQGLWESNYTRSTPLFPIMIQRCDCWRPTRWCQLRLHIAGDLTHDACGTLTHATRAYRALVNPLDYIGNMSLLTASPAAFGQAQHQGLGGTQNHACDQSR